jgi:type I restriction enzyme S subunit
MMRHQRDATRTGGREATTRHIPPKLALSVGMPSTPAPKGWRWVALTELARLESGHTPSRRHPEYWGGSIPWISIQDAKGNDGRTIVDTQEHTNELGIANSSARVLPERTVCLSRTASVGYVVVMGSPMATSQDFVNWICEDQLDADYLKYLYIAEGDGLLRFASGAVHQTIYFPEVKAFHVCLPPIGEQKRIVATLDQALEAATRATANTDRNVSNAEALYQSFLDDTFLNNGDGATTQRLGDLADLITKGTTPTSVGHAFVDEGIAFIKVESISESGQFLPEKIARISKACHEALRRSQLQSGDILFSIAGALGRTALVTDDIIPANTNQALSIIRLKKSVEILHSYVLTALSTGVVLKQIKEFQGGVAQQNLSLAQVRNLTIPIPPIADQQRIVDAVALFAADVQRLRDMFEKKRSLLGALTSSLLQQAFSGRM